MVSYLCQGDVMVARMGTATGGWGATKINLMNEYDAGLQSRNMHC
jgi:hypothetical protein